MVMESNAMATGLYSSMGSGMLGLEMSLQHHQLPPPQQSMQQHQSPPLIGFTLHESTEQPQQPQAHMAVKPGYPFAAAAKPKNQALTLSDDDEAAGIGTENSGEADGKRKVSPWQRMKWTDNMVRLLIMVVYYIGDEGGSEGNIDPGGKKKAAGVLQKKGKWKSVSTAMMERGFYVSPQQCEDKFNDLNKRYKRVNDILGKGTSCKVVENQSLLDTMDHLSAKTKEEVKKLLNSKHLFFREMCAYHNSCGHGGGGGTQQSQSPEIGAEPSHVQHQQQQICLHSSANASIAPNMGRGEVQGSKFAKGGLSREEDEDEEDDDDNGNEDEEEDDEDDDDDIRGGSRGHHDHGHDADDDTTVDERSSRKRLRNGGFLSPSVQRLSAELVNVFQDETKNPVEKRQWIKSRLLQLEEEHVGYQSQAFELEKQRLKWVKFSSKKEREMERDKLKNERMRLENERMVLLIRQKELELLDLYQHQHLSSRKSDPSSITG